MRTLATVCSICPTFQVMRTLSISAIMSGLENPNPILMPGIANDLVREDATMRLLNLSTMPESVMSTYPGTSSRSVSSRKTSVPVSSHALTMEISFSLGSTLPVGLFGLQM